MHYSDLDRSDTIFTHVLPSGENINIAASRLREFLLAHPQESEPTRHLIPIDPKLAQSFIDRNTVNFKRVMNLRVLHCREPIILGKDGTFTNGRPDVFFIDGHHRYVRAFIANCPTIEGFVLEPKQWRPFLVSGLPPTTVAELEAWPTLNDHINYGTK